MNSLPGLGPDGIISSPHRGHVTLDLCQASNLIHVAHVLGPISASEMPLAICGSIASQPTPQNPLGCEPQVGLGGISKFSMGI